MPITDYIANPGDLISAEGWNAIIDEITLKVFRAGDTMTGPLSIEGSGANGGSGSFISTNNGNSLSVTGRNGAGVNDVAYLSFHNSADAGHDTFIGLSGDSGVTAGDLRFANGGNVEKMRLALNGNLGIGTSSPQSRLHFTGDLTTDWAITFNHYDPNFTDVPSRVRPWLRKTWNNTLGDFLTLCATGNRSNELQSSMILGSTGIYFGRGHDDADQLSTEWARFKDTNGFFGIKQNDPQYTFDVRGNIRTTGSVYFGANNPDTRIFNGDYTSNFVIGPSATKLNMSMRHNPASDAYLFRIGHTVQTTSGGGSFPILIRAFDTKMSVNQAGVLRAEGAVIPNGADYAELFESQNGKPIPSGSSVVLTGDGNVRKAKKGEKPIGIITATPAILGNDPMEWSGKYVTDEFGVRLMEKYEEEVPISEEAAEQLEALPKSKLKSKAARKGLTKVIKGMRAKVNSEYNSELTYVPRSERPEWQAVGLLGQLRLRKGSPTAPTWVKIKDLSSKVELWLVK